MPMPQRVLGFAALGLALLAAGAAGLIVLPSPSHAFALLAIVVGERSLFVVAAGALAAVTALAVARARRGRGLAAVTLLLGGLAIAIGLLPPLEARQVARARGLPLDVGRYLRARIDTEGPVSAPLTLTYATVEGRALALDVYPAAGGGALAPASRPIVVIHGGGWSAGDKGDASLFSRWLAGHGFTVFDVEYRLAPQPSWAAALADVRCAMRWVAEHTRTAAWNIDPRRLTLLGRSAGGHLALLAAYTADEAGAGAPAPSGEVRGPVRVDAVIALYPVTDLRLGYAHPARPRVYDSRQRLLGFVGGPPASSGDLYRALSPSEHVGAASPRTLLFHGGRDQFVSDEQSRELYERLRATSDRHALVIIPYAQHAFDFVFGGFSEQLVEGELLRLLAEPAATAK